MSRRMFQSCNIGACSFGLWIATESFIRAINAIVWSDNVDNVAPYWCDIGQLSSSMYISYNKNPNLYYEKVTRIDIATLPSIPASSFLIIRRLARSIQRNDRLSPGTRINVSLCISLFPRAESKTSSKRSNIIMDIFICVCCPIIQIISCKYRARIICAFHLSFEDYFMQEFRFEIYEEIGCFAAMRNYRLSTMLLTSMPILFPLASLTLYSRAYFMLYPARITDTAQQRSSGSTSSVSEALTTGLTTPQTSTATCTPGCLLSA